jgi:hypothetical protein
LSFCSGSIDKVSGQRSDSNLPFPRRDHQSLIVALFGQIGDQMQSGGEAVGMDSNPLPSDLIADSNAARRSA